MHHCKYSLHVMLGFFFTLICCSTSSPDVQSIFKFNDFSGYLRNAQYLTKNTKTKKGVYFYFLDQTVLANRCNSLVNSFIFSESLQRRPDPHCLQRYVQ